MHELYVVGCFVSLGFYLGTIDQDFIEENTGAWFLGVWVCTFLSWASVIADIINEVKKENK
ncbi:MAG: hypothetical protein M0R03_16785 [Novosphingobium sp.]|nr:hypothetical protein [Novosphingobium sp.]